MTRQEQRPSGFFLVAVRHEGIIHASRTVFTARAGATRKSGREAKGIPLKKKACIGALLVSALFTVACRDKMIPNTEIPDNEDNRAIVAFCERYRHAVEDLNVGLVLSLASQRYFDNAGTPTPDDDIDREGLEKMLLEKFKDVKTMRYEIRYRNIYETIGVVYVEYTYNMAFQYQVGDKAKWANRTSDNRLELERVDGGFRVLAGM